MDLTPKAWETYKKWRDGMEREYGQIIYAPAAPRVARLRFDGPLCLDIPSPDMWTVIDPASPHFKRSLCIDSLMALGFTAAELYETKSKSGGK